jgi:hypothetical protein
MKFIFMLSLLFKIVSVAAVSESRPIVEYRDCEFPPTCEVIRVFENGQVAFYNPVQLSELDPPAKSYRENLMTLANPILNPLLERARSIKSQKMLPTPTQDRKNGLPWHQELKVFDAKSKARTVLKIAPDGKYLAVDEWQARRIYTLLSDLIRMARTQAEFQKK